MRTRTNKARTGNKARSKELIHIGTSGWSYKSWEKTFYPADIPRRWHFEFYATQFPTVEINLTFYRLPSPDTVRGWRDRAPNGFQYAVKGSRFITHMKKLAHIEDALDKFFERIKLLKQQLGPILWQLPRGLKKDAARLDNFLRQLPRGYRYAVEFRHPSWLDNDIFQLLRKRGVALVSVSSDAMPMNLTVTTDFIYIRFHGLSGGAAHDYTRTELEPWAAHIRAQRGKEVFAYFNNDVNTRAPENARLLMELVSSGQEDAKIFPAKLPMVPGQSGPATKLKFA
ncbi:MAG: hypothetical protein JWR19_1221 [Pedosphaera sp.]|nr:hypothetical protein [Pedosphaera sp.]